MNILNGVLNHTLCTLFLRYIAFVEINKTFVHERIINQYHVTAMDTLQKGLLTDKTSMFATMPHTNIVTFFCCRMSDLDMIQIKHNVL